MESCRRAGQTLPTLGLLGGDLCRTLGGPGDEARLRSDDAMTFQVDVGAALLDGRLHWFVAHLIARRSWWRGRLVAVMNAEWLGAWDLGPRSASRRRPPRHQRRQAAVLGPPRGPPAPPARHPPAAPGHRHDPCRRMAGGLHPAARHLARRRQGHPGHGRVGPRRARRPDCRCVTGPGTSLRPWTSTTPRPGCATRSTSGPTC